MKMRSSGFYVSNKHIREAGKNISWPGRLEWWGEHKNLLIDVAHNRAGIGQLAEYLVEQKIKRVHLVVGLSGERDPETVLKPLVKFATSVYAVPVSYNQVLSPEDLCRWAEGHGIASRQFSSAEEGLSVALSAASQSAPVLVCGSLYLVAELRGRLLEGGTAPRVCSG
jgi:dihydrofolate synthase/folylpolyglutamate synthase